MGSLSHTITNPINQMITITDYISYTKYDIETFGACLIWIMFDPIVWMIPLTMIPLSGTNCSMIIQRTHQQWHKEKNVNFFKHI
jgi:hypothetical protein